MITLSELENKHRELGEMISSFKNQVTRYYNIPGGNLELGTGELYAGLILNNDGSPNRHLILMPGEIENVNWKEAWAWAEVRGELPSSQEQALLYANLKSQFRKAWYWSGTQYSNTNAYRQDFDTGYQHPSGKSWPGGSARAVRRVFV